MNTADYDSEEGKQLNDGDSIDQVVETRADYGAPPEEDVINAPIARYYALLAGGALTTLGILGFIPAFTQGGALFDVLRVTTTANVLHLVTGIPGLIVWGLNRRGTARVYALALGTVYFIYFSIGNIVFGNLDGTPALDTAIHRFQWITYNGLHAGLMLVSWLVAALAYMQKGDRSTREYRSKRRWFWQSRTRLPVND